MQAIAAIICGALLAATPPDVPLSLWRSASYPEGLSFGGTMGISFGDYDGDGFTDVFACWSGNLWRNVGGADWQLAGNLSSSLPPTERRYGSSFGDYDNDGFPDIAMAPRVPFWGDDRMHLMHNVGGGVSFVDVAGNPAIVDVQPYGNAETLCWADVNGDGNLDVFVPAYPSWEGGPGNFFLLNEGPVGPGGAYRFVESSEAAGLDNPQGTSRPEGAQFVDVDADGDVDLFANGTLYQNVSSSSSAAFNALDAAVSGIGLPDALDEGAMFFDYDLDGDFDLVAAYASAGVRIWENRGDGTFVGAEAGIVDQPMTGLNLGMSAEDWDNDGDVDFTTRGVFRRNMLVEEDRRHFSVASTAIPPADISSATPAWGDWDRDGDLDCALGNWGADGRLYENTTYSPAIAESAKGYLRVRAVRDSRTVARGLETEYGASAEVRVQSGSRSLRRRKFVASSHGYLNQNEYALHFGLPPGVAVDVSVDFPGLAAAGPWRVDKSVNPVLAALDPSALANRELTVTRCGDVIIDGQVHEPIPLATPRLTTTAGGLSLPHPGATLAAPNPTQSDWYAGLDFDTLSATQPLVVKEILLDGQLDAPQGCSAGERNLVLWDMTDASHPEMVAGGILTHATSSRNRRSVFPVDIVLAPRRSFRLVARVTEFRSTPIAAPVTTGGITLRGGLSFKDQNACNGQRAAAATNDLTGTALALRFAPLPADSRLDPLGASVRLSRAVGQPVVLEWTDVGAPGYRILRCSAAAGACTPQRYADSPSAAFTDSGTTPQPGELFWYLVKAVSSCAAGI